MSPFDSLRKHVFFGNTYKVVQWSRINLVGSICVRRQTWVVFLVRWGGVDDEGLPTFGIMAPTKLLLLAFCVWYHYTLLYKLLLIWSTFLVDGPPLGCFFFLLQSETLVDDPGENLTHFPSFTLRFGKYVGLLWSIFLKYIGICMCVATGKNNTTIT